MKNIISVTTESNENNDLEIIIKYVNFNRIYIKKELFEVKKYVRYKTILRKNIERNKLRNERRKKYVKTNSKKNGTNEIETIKKEERINNINTIKKLEINPRFFSECLFIGTGLVLGAATIATIAFFTIKDISNILDIFKSMESPIIPEEQIEYQDSNYNVEDINIKMMHK